MARRYYNRARNYGGRAYNYARSNYGRARSWGSRQQKGAIQLRVGQEWLAGAAIGMTNMDEKIPNELKLAGATMPVSGRYGGKAKAVFQGMIFGNLAQYYLKFRLPGGDATNEGEGL
jgi:hypothetical protein